MIRQTIHQRWIDINANSKSQMHVLGADQQLCGKQSKKVVKKSGIRLRNDLFLYCYERDFMSNLQKSKWFDLIDKFLDTTRYLDDILFTSDNPELA